MYVHAPIVTNIYVCGCTSPRHRHSVVLVVGVVVVVHAVVVIIGVVVGHGEAEGAHGSTESTHTTGKKRARTDDSR